MGWNFRNLSLLVTLLFVVLFFSSFASAWDFYGNSYDVDGNALYNASVNITIWSMAGGPPTLVGYNLTYSNETGFFNMSVTENSNWFYKPVIRHFLNNATDGSTAIDYVGQSLPEFPYQEFYGVTNIDFYLKEAGTINISAVNLTGDAKTFQYIIKDTTLGYPIEEQFSSYVSSAIIYVPRDRNYTIQIYPNESMPVSYHWNNFSSSSDYEIVAGLAHYNATTKVLNKTFNCSEDLIWVSGYGLNTTFDYDDYNEFSVVPFILEGGNMVYLGDDVGFPSNMSAWRLGQEWTDSYSLSNGFYNITLPGTAESANYILFATARNGTDYYGGYRNISLSYGDADTEINFTMYKLMSSDWASSTSNITMADASTWQNINISSAKQAFNLVNATSGAILQNLNAHIEATVDYSDYNATEFTFMMDVNNADGIFYIPLINATGIKEINVYSNNYAPKSWGPRNPVQILTNNNISLSTFSPEDIDGSSLSSDISVGLYLSNSTCDVPVPGNSCTLADSADMDNFNPLSAIMGGGKISFRMGLISSGIIVHYVNVDMMASGPPDALFDDSATTSTSGSFSSAMRFGSNGPKIYDHVLISIPYTEGSSSQTGLNESSQVNMSIPLLYAEGSSGNMDWDNPIWDTSVNGTNATMLAGNHSHYSTRSSEWQTLLEDNICVTSVGTFNSTNPCYLDATNNRIWIRLPHFSGTKPSITGSVITATTNEDDGSSGGGSGVSGSFSYWTKGTITVSREDFEKGHTRELSIRQRMKLRINNSDHHVGVVGITNTIVVVNVSSTPQQAILNIGEEKKFDVDENNIYDMSILLNSINFTISKANLTVLSISEPIVEKVMEDGQNNETQEQEDLGQENEEGFKKISRVWVYFVVGGILLVGFIVFFILFKKKK